MWFLFGFITFLSFSFYFGYKRLHAAWKGSEGSADNIAYQYKILSDKYGTTGLLVGIGGPSEYDFAFKKEKWYDRLFKSFGVSVEHQIGNKEFDDLVYVVSDDKVLQQQISINKSIVDVILESFAYNHSFECALKEIRCNSGRLWLKFKANRSFKEEDVPQLADTCVPLLEKISAELPQLQLVPNRKRRDPFILKAAIFLAISSGLAVNGVVQLIRLNYINLPFTVDDHNLLMHSLLAGGVIIVSLIIAMMFLLERSARAHLVLIELMFIGSFGAVSSVFAGLRDINIELDRSAAVEYTTKIEDKNVVNSRRSTSYYLYLVDWDNDEVTRKIEVTRYFYMITSIGENVLVSQKPGFLNYRWVDDLERNTND